MRSKLRPSFKNSATGHKKGHFEDFFKKMLIIPQAMQAFFESTSFEDAIRNAVSIGGDSDTLAAITGAVAEAYYGMTEREVQDVATRLDRTLLKIFEDFRKSFAN